MPAIGDIFQYTFNQNLLGTVMQTVIHMRAVVAAPTEAQLKLSAENWLLSMRPLQSNQVQYTSVHIKRMTPIPFDELIYIPTGSTTGQVATPANNTQLAIVFSKKTGVAGLSHRGRMYVGGFPVGVGDNHVSNPGYLTAMGTAAGEFLAKFQEGGTDGSVVAGIYSRSIGGSTPFTLAGWQAITKWVPQLVMGVQRRRREGVGI